MKIRTAKKIQRSRNRSYRKQFIAVKGGGFFMPSPRTKDLMRRARARLRKYMMRHFKPKSQYGYISPTLLPRKEKEPDGYLLGVPYYREPRAPKDRPPKVLEFDFRHKFHRIHGSPRNNPSVKSVSSVPNKEKPL